MKNKKIKLTSITIISVLFLIILSIPISSAPSINLIPDKISNRPAGTTVTWTAFYMGIDPLEQVYRFTVTSEDNKITVLRDYHRKNNFKWTPVDEGIYNVNVKIQNKETHYIYEYNRTFNIKSALFFSTPSVKSTNHPLVALYCSPPVTGDEMRIHFKPISGGAWQTTLWKTCKSGKSVNFIVAGMKKLTTYKMMREVKKNGIQFFLSTTRYYTSGLPLVNFQKFEVLNAADYECSNEQGIILHGTILQKLGFGCPVATDLQGNVVWYYGDVKTLVDAGTMAGRPTNNGTFLFDINDIDGSLKRGQMLREIDLLCSTVRETSIWAINEQLKSLGHDTINCFHHDSVRLDNGHTLFIASVERIIEDVQSNGPVDILGDMIIDLDENWNVVWAWNSFDHLDVERAAVLGEAFDNSAFSPGGPIYLDDNANDWTHTNTCTYSPSDGNLVISSRNQDWCVKIDYSDGTGSGDILWRLGPEGDFNIDSDDPYPWFSHQHQVMIYNDNEYVIYDNGNTRYHLNGDSGNSRGQAYILDEVNMTAELILNMDLGLYSNFLGSAQKLSNGNYFFLSGGIDPWFGDDNPVGAYSQAYEVTPDGRIIYVLESQAATYRSYRLKNLYEGLWE